MNTGFESCFIFDDCKGPAERQLEIMLFFSEFKEVMDRHGYQCPHAALQIQVIRTELQQGQTSSPVVKVAELADMAWKAGMDFNWAFSRYTNPEAMRDLGVLSDPTEFFRIAKFLKLNAKQQIQAALLMNTGTPQNLALNQVYIAANSGGASSGTAAFFSHAPGHRVEILEAKEGIRKFRELGYTDAAILEAYIAIKGMNLNTVSYINTEKGKMPKIDVGHAERLDSACQDIKQVSPTVLLNELLYTPDKCNPVLERGVVLKIFESNGIIPAEGKVLAIDPSPRVIQELKSRTKERLVCCVRTAQECLILKHIFPKIEFLTRADLQGKKEDIYQSVLMFWRDDNRFGEWNWLLSSDKIADNACVGLFLPNTVLNKDNALRSLVAEGYANGELVLLPDGIAKTAAKRWTILSAQRGKADSAQIKIRILTLVGSPNGKHLAEKNEKTPIVLSDEEFASYTKKDKKGTIIQLVNLKRQALNVPGCTRKKPTDYYITGELAIQCLARNDPKTGKIKAIASVSHLPTEKQFHQGQRKGTRLIAPSQSGHVKPVEWTKLCTSEEEVVEWVIEELPYRPQVQDALNQVFHKGLQDESPILNTVSLATLWYLGLENVKKYSLHQCGKDARRNERKHLMRSEVGKLTPEADLEEFKSAMDQLSHEEGWSWDKEKRMWKLMDQLVDQAREEGYCSTNNIKVHIRETYDKPSKRQRGAGVLQKKTLQTDEMRRLLNMLLDRLENRDIRFLPVLIRLLTGLEADITAGLKWKDLRQIVLADESFGQFRVCRRIAKVGKQLEEQALREMADYRHVPIMHILLSVLLRRMSDVVERLGIPEGDLQNMYVCWNDQELEKAKQGETVPPPNPWEIQKSAREAIKLLNIDESVIHMPGADGTLKEKDLSQYSGDLLRENFRHHCGRECEVAMTEDEERYLLGLKPETTFGAHYCDMRNDFMQLRMFVKLERLEAALVDKGTSGMQSIDETKQIGGKTQEWTVSTDSGCVCMDITLTAKQVMVLNLQLSARRGISGKILKYGG